MYTNISYTRTIFSVYLSERDAISHVSLKTDFHGKHLTYIYRREYHIMNLGKYVCDRI